MQVGDWLRVTPGQWTDTEGNAVASLSVNSNATIPRLKSTALVMVAHHGRLHWRTEVEAPIILPHRKLLVWVKFHAPVWPCQTGTAKVPFRGGSKEVPWRLARRNLHTLGVDGPIHTYLQHVVLLCTGEGM